MTLLDEIQEPAISDSFRERTFSFSTLDADLRVAVLVSWLLLSIVPILLIFRTQLGPATVSTEFGFKFSPVVVACGLLFSIASQTLVLSGAMVARPAIRYGVVTLLWFANTAVLLLPFYAAIYAGLMDRQEMPSLITIARTMPWLGIISAIVLAMLIWIAAKRARQRSLRGVIWPCAAILLGFWAFVWIARTQLGIKSVMASTGVRDVFATTVATQLAALFILITPAFMVTGHDFAEWWGMLGVQIGEWAGKRLREPLLWTSAAGVALVCAATALSSWWRPFGSALWLQGGILTAGALVSYLVYVARRTTWSLLLSRVTVPYIALFCAAVMFTGIFFMEVGSSATPSATQFILNGSHPFTIQHPAGWKIVVGHVSFEDQVRFLGKGVTFDVLRIEPHGPDITSLDMVSSALDPVQLNFRPPDPNGWSSRTGAVTVKGARGPISIKFIAWRKVEGDTGRDPGASWYLVGTSLPATYPANLTRFLKMRDSWDLHPRHANPASNEANWLLLGAAAATALLLAPRTRLSRNAEHAIWFVLVLAIFLAVRNSGMTSLGNLPPSDSAVVDAEPLDARAMSTIQLAVATGTLGSFLWYAIRWRPRARGNLPVTLIGFNLALLLTRLFAEWFRHASQMGDTALTIAAILMLAGLGWEILMSGHITNRHSETTPRRARVLMYFGYILFAANGVFFFGPQLWQGVLVEGASTEKHAAAGIVLLGFPWIMTVFTGRLMSASDNTVGESREELSRRSRWVIGLVAVAVVIMATYIALWARSDPYRILMAPNSLETEVTNTSGSGRTIGWYTDSELQEHGFWYFGGRYHPVEWGGPWDRVPILHPQGINDEGQIAGNFHDVDQLSHGFITSADGKVQAFDVPGSVETQVVGMGMHGDFAATFKDGRGHWHGLVLVRGNQKRIEVPSADDTIIEGISYRGELAGIFTDAKGQAHGFYSPPPWNADEFVRIDYPGASDTFINGIGVAGAAVGEYDIHGRHKGVFVWDQEKFRALNPPIDKFSPTGIDRAGHVVGTYTDVFGRKNGLILFQPTRGGLWWALPP